MLGLALPQTRPGKAQGFSQGRLEDKARLSALPLRTKLLLWSKNLPGAATYCPAWGLSG